MIPTLRLYRLPAEVAVLSTEPAVTAPGSASADRLLIRFTRGPLGKQAKPTLATAYGPYPVSELQARWDELVAGLEGQGFGRSAAVLSIAALQHGDRRQRALLARRLGRARAVGAVDALVQALQGATDEACSIVDALGAIGDPRAIAAVRPYAERKLLSRRRSGVEALRNLGDVVGLAAAAKRATDELAGSGLQDAALLGPLDGSPDPDVGGGVDALTKAVLALPAKHRGRCADLLYELATPRTSMAARRVLLNLPLDAPFSWRYVKSVLKRAMLRRDHAMVGWLAHRLEVLAPTLAGRTAEVKSGKDGQTRVTPIFRRGTQRWVRRALWRHLRELARWRPDEYPRAAAEVLVHFAPQDARAPKGRYGEWAHSHLLNAILWSGGPRLERVDRTLRWRFRSAKAAAQPVTSREEAFPALWDARPLAYLRLLSAARLPDVQAFAARAVAERHFDLLHEASGDELLGMLAAPHERTVELATGELAKRWDPAAPDWALLERLVRSEQPRLREAGQAWLRAGAPLWTREAARALALLALPAPEVRALVAELLVAAAPGLDADTRLALARGVLEALRAPEAREGAHTAYGVVAREGLAPELDALLGVPELLGFVERGSVSVKAVAGHLLGRRAGALAQLGLTRVLALCEHEVALVRAAGHALVQGAVDALVAEPGPLFVLAESAWEDTRRLAFGIIQERLDLAGYGPAQRLEALVGLCDSNRPDVQAFGRELVLRWFREVDPREVMARLAEHPGRGMKRFALDLIEDHLPAGAEALARVAFFFGTILLDVRPDRRLKRQAVDFLLARGRLDFEQARVAAQVLDGWVRTCVRADRERALQALTTLTLDFPDLRTSLEVRA